MATPREKLIAQLNRAQEKRIERLLQDAGFRRFILTVTENAGMDRDSFHHGSPDATSFNEGRRSVGLDITAMLMRVDPTARLLLEQERLAWMQTLPIPGEPNADPHPFDQDADEQL